MKNITAKILFVLPLALAQIGAHSQDLPTVVPPSPTAAGLAKYGDVPVGLYTGVPSVSIPIYELKGSQLKLPISLSYHASGIKVEENSSWVGLGWSLNAGGVITRSNKGLRDEATGGFITAPPIPAVPTMLDFFLEVKNQHLDPEPDIFFFNFNGYSGKFYLEKRQGTSNTTKGHCIPHKDISIVCTFTIDVITSFTIRTEDGTQYLFDKFEQTSNYSEVWDAAPTIQGNPPVRVSNSIPGGIPSITGWYLSEIRSAVGDEVITFTYVAEKYKYETAKHGRISYSSFGQLRFKTMMFNEYTMDALRLASLRFDKIRTTVNFTAAKIRADVNNLPNPNINPNPTPAMALEEISISHDDFPAPIKKFALSTTYFTNPASATEPAGKQYLFKRLRLDQVTELSGDGTESKPPHKFGYDSHALPPKNAETQDHWGFYNGPVDPEGSAIYYTTNYMIPAYYGEVDTSWDFFGMACAGKPMKPVSRQHMALLDIKGVNREPAASMQCGILNKITYPTAGISEITYEGHQYGYIAGDQITKDIHGKTSPGAFIERPWGNNPTGDETVERLFTVPKDGAYKVWFSLELGYRNQQEYQDGRAFNRRQRVKLDGIGSEYTHPMVDVFWDFDGSNGDFRYSSVDPYSDDPNMRTYAGSVKLSTLHNIQSILYNADITEEGGDTNWYGRRRGAGWVVVKLKAGTTYKFTAIREYDKLSNCPFQGFCYTNNNEASIFLEYEIDSEVVLYTKRSFDVGGLRVAKMKQTPGVGGTPVETSYSYMITDANNVDTDRSSGSLVSLVDHTNTEVFYEEEVHTGDGCTVTELTVFTDFTVESDYVMPLSTTQGSHISYRQVRVSQTGNGSTITRFLTAADYPDEYPREIYTQSRVTGSEDEIFVHTLNPENEVRYRNYLPQNNNDWKRGFETGKTTLDQSGNTVAIEEHSYTFVENNLIPGLQVFIYNGGYVNNSNTSYTLDRVAYNRYTLTSGWVYEDQKTVTTFDQGNGLSTVNNYYHESPNHISLTRETQSTSSGPSLETRYVYAADKPALTNTPSTVFDQMVVKNMLYPVVKKEVYRGSTLVNGQVNNYRLDNANLLPASAEISQGGAYETRLLYSAYDSRGNILGYKKSDDASTGFIWDYDSSYPVASVTNAAYDKIAYTSFESNGTGNWTFTGPKVHDITPKTGSNYYKFNAGNITRSLSPGKYMLTYWAQGSVTVTGGTLLSASTSPPDANNWILYQAEINVTSTATLTISGTPTAIIDELRLYPSGAQMTTYTYDPHVGMTTKVDENNVKTVYLYDKLGRVTAITDQFGNILKKYTYHYAGQ